MNTTASRMVPRAAILALSGLALVLTSACSSTAKSNSGSNNNVPPPPASDAGDPQPQGPVTLPFLLSDEFKPSGYMGDSQSDYNGIVMSRDATDCKAPRNPDAAGDCYSITWTPTMLANATSAWVGVYWQYPANNWGAKSGLAIEPGATKVTFWAAGAAGGESLIFTVGGINDAPTDPTLPNKDSFTAPLSVTLTTDWKQYSIPLDSATYDSVIGGFSWVAKTTTSEAVKFYIDDVRWEK